MESKLMINARNVIEEINNNVIDEMKNPNIHLIGEIYLPLDEYEKLKENFSKLSHKYFNMNAADYKESLVYLLVKNAQRYYDGNFWDHLSFKTNHKQRQEIKDIFIKVCEKYDFPIFEEESKAGFSIITPFICHAGIPNEQLESFFSAFDNYYESGEIFSWWEMVKSKQILHRSTMRYFNFLGDDLFPFLLQWESVTDYYDETNSTREIHSLLEKNFEGDNILIPERYIEKYSEWQSKSTIEVSGKKRVGKQRFVKPVISIDSEGNGLLLILPEQEIPKSYDPNYANDKLVWLIYIGDVPKRIETNIYQNVLQNRYLTDEYLLTLRQPDIDSFQDIEEIKVQVYYNDIDHHINTWNLDFMPNGYSIFDLAGKKMIGNKINRSDFMLFASEEYDQIECKNYEPSSIPFWQDYGLFRISLQRNEKMTLTNSRLNTNFEIEKTEGYNLPELANGQKFFNNDSIYLELPNIVFAEKTDTPQILYVSNEELGTMEHPISKNTEKILLADILEKDVYGKYELRIKGLRRTIFRTSFYYIPAIELENNVKFWPEPGKGYQSNHYQFLLPLNADIALDGFQKEFEDTIYEDQKRIRFESIEQKNSIGGMILLKSEELDKETKIPFKMSARPILWAIETFDESNKIISYQDTPIFYTDEEIKSLREPYLFLSAGDIGVPKMTIGLQAIDNKGHHFYKTKLFINSEKTTSYPLIDLFNSVPGKTTQYSLAISLFTPTGEKIRDVDYPILKARPAVKHSQIEMEFFDQASIQFSWQEYSPPTERGLFMTNLTNSWKDSQYFPVYEDYTDLILPKKVIEPGVYAACIDVPQQKRLFDIQNYYEPKSWSGQNILIMPPEDIKEKSLWAFNYYLLSYLLLEKDEFFEYKNLPGELIIDDPTKVINLCKSFLTIKSFENLEKEEQSGKETRYETIVREYRNVARNISMPKEELLKTILNADFSESQYLELFSFFELIFLTDQEVKIMNWTMVYHDLERTMPDFAFQIAMGTNSHLESVEKWIGTYSLRELLGDSNGSNPTQIMQDQIENQIKTKKWASHPDYWGSYDEVKQFSIQYSKDLRFKKYQNKSLEEYLEYYEKEYKSSLKKIFGKSYLRIRSDLNSKIANNKVIEKVTNNLNDCVSVEIKPYFNYLKNNYAEAFNRIRNMASVFDSSEADLAVYTIYLIMFVGTLYRQGIWNYQTSLILRNIDRIRRYFPELYQHTLVIFDLYIRDGGE